VEETKHQCCQAARAGGHHAAHCLPKICPSWQRTSGNSVGYCGGSLVERLQIPSAPRRRCFLRSSAWDLVTAEPSQPRSTCAAEGFISHASYLPAGARRAHIFPCSADLPPSGRSLQVPKHESPSRPSDHPFAEGQVGRRAAGITTVTQLFGWERQKAACQVH